MYCLVARPGLPTNEFKNESCSQAMRTTISTYKPVRLHVGLLSSGVVSGEGCRLG